MLMHQTSQLLRLDGVYDRKETSLGSILTAKRTIFTRTNQRKVKKLGSLSASNKNLQELLAAWFNFVMKNGFDTWLAAGLHHIDMSPPLPLL